MPLHQAAKREADEEMEAAASEAGVSLEQYQAAIAAQQEQFEAKKKAKLAGDAADLGACTALLSLTENNQTRCLAFTIRHRSSFVSAVDFSLISPLERRSH